MGGSYLDFYRQLPEFLRRRINPLEFGIRRAVEEAVSRTSGLTVLDAGAGEARFSEVFSDHFYVAIDSKVGDSEWDYSGIDVCADLGAIPLKSGSVDLVVNTQVLEHVAEPQKVLAEFSRVLRDGGRLVLTAPQGWHEHQQPNDYYRFTRFSLERLLRGAGFRRFCVEPLGGYFHYLGHRLTYVPKILFLERSGVVRVLLLPLELFSLFFFCLLCPILCFYLDRLDKKREFTLCYRVLGVK